MVKHKTMHGNRSVSLFLHDVWYYKAIELQHWCHKQRQVEFSGFGSQSLS